jgi:pimeloyl-ACP methyl ester carboxylesterase
MRPVFLIGLLLTASLAFGQPTATGKRVTIFNRNIYYQEYGKGHTLLLLHGGAGSHDDFKAVIPELAKHYHVIAPDSPGHGRSEQADSLSYPLLAAYFSAFIDKLQLKDVYVIGFSDGGNAALLLAANRADKISRVMVSGANATTAGLGNESNSSSATFTPDNVEKGSADWLKWYKSLSPQPDQWKKFVDDSRKMWMRPLAIPETSLKKIKCPVLLIKGENDIITPEHGAYLNRMVQGSRLVVIPGSSHYTFGQNPERMIELAVGFFPK